MLDNTHIQGHTHKQLGESSTSDNVEELARKYNKRMVITPAWDDDAKPGE